MDDNLSEKRLYKQIRVVLSRLRRRRNKSSAFLAMLQTDILYPLFEKNQGV
jgi:hypothetical protein